MGTKQRPDGTVSTIERALLGPDRPPAYVEVRLRNAEFVWQIVEACKATFGGDDWPAIATGAARRDLAVAQEAIETLVLCLAGRAPRDAGRVPYCSPPPRARHARQDDE